MFLDREEAGHRLARHLQSYKNKEAVVLAIPRGGLPLGEIVAKELNAPLDVAIIKKIGHPYNPEYAAGALNEEGYVLNPEARISEEFLEEEVQRLRQEILKRHQQYYAKTQPHDVRGKWVIIVDDGIATGSTILATVALVAKKDPAGIVIATPVAPASTIRKLQSASGVDEVVCLEQPPYFSSVGQFYENFFSVSDEEAIEILERANQGYNINKKGK